MLLATVLPLFYLKIREYIVFGKYRTQLSLVVFLWVHYFPAQINHRVMLCHEIFRCYPQKKTTVLKGPGFAIYS